MTLPQIVSDICKVFNVGEDLIRSSCRKKELVLYRQIYIYVTVQKTNFNFNDIGDEICRTDHATIIHHIEKVSNFLKYQDPMFTDQWNKYLKQSELFSKKDFEETLKLTTDD